LHATDAQALGLGWVWTRKSVFSEVLKFLALLSKCVCSRILNTLAYHTEAKVTHWKYSKQ
jgi:hypothetical protein